MRIERPRSPQMVTVTIRGQGNVLRPKVGYAQHQMLGLLMAIGKSEKPPKGMLTPTGVLREHILNDMIPLGWVDAKRLQPGITDYLITKLGREVHKHGIVQDAPKVVKKRGSSLLERQRSRARTRAAGRQTQTGRRRAVG